MKVSVMTLGLIVLAVVPMLAAAEIVSITLPPETIALDPGPGADQTQTQCRMCHSLDYITTQPRVSAPAWEGVVTKMMKVYGAPLSDPEAKVIAEYLAKHYGTVPRGQ